MLADWNVPFRALIDAAPDGIVVCDERGAVVLVNAEAERMFGYRQGELLGLPIETLIPEHARPGHVQHLAGYTQAPRLRAMGQALDLRARRKDGSELPVEISLSPFASGRGLLIIAGVRDVTERRELERENRRTSAYLVSAVEAVKDAFTLYDEHDRVIMMNSAARQLLGEANAGAVIGQPFPKLLRAGVDGGRFDVSHETRESLYARWLAYHHEPDGVLEVRSAAGRHLRVTCRKTAEGGTLSVVADVTGDVQRAEELDRAREQAETASAAKSEFLSSMSHELRTPLNAILGFAQLLERDRKRPLDARQLERLGHVLRGGEHLLRLIDDVLDLSRIEARQISVSSEPVDVAEVMAQVVTTLEPMAARMQIEIVVEPTAHGLPRVIADRTRLSQILMNFGSNAIKYGKPSGHVALRAALQPAALRVAVRDDGIGIPDDKRARIFEPFHRAGQETGPIEGTGIGLTISRRLAELMRGSIGFTSEVGRGSEFWIDLPIHRQTTIEIAAVRDGAVAASPLATGSGRHTIVYVEDNPSNIAFMRELIDELPSVALITAPSAEIGLDLIRAHLPKAVIMDINLPGMSGLEAVQRLRAWPETRDIPVIGLSAAALVKDTTKAREAGFYRYHTKPVKVAELTHTLEELLLDK